MKRLIMGLMLLPAAVYTQKTDVCKSDSVIRVLPGNGKVELIRRECPLIVMSDTVYQTLMVAAVQADSMRIAIPEYIEAVKAESDARKKAESELESFTKIQAVTIDGYEGRLDAALDAGVKAATELDKCKDDLDKETTRRKWAWPKGFVAGLITGAAAVVTVILL